MWSPVVMTATPGAQQVDGNFRGDAPAVGAVLAVDDHEVDPLAFTDAREEIDDRAPAGFADDVAQEQDVEHGLKGPP